MLLVSCDLRSSLWGSSAKVRLMSPYLHVLGAPEDLGLTFVERMCSWWMSHGCKWGAWRKKEAGRKHRGKQWHLMAYLLRKLNLSGVPNLHCHLFISLGNNESCHIRSIVGYFQRKRLLINFWLSVLILTWCLAGPHCYLPLVMTCGWQPTTQPLPPDCPVWFQPLMPS